MIETHPLAALHLADCLDWLRARQDRSLHAIVTDPPFTVVDFEPATLDAKGKDRGSWRKPPTLGGSRRAPVPRFTELSPAQLARARAFFRSWAAELPRVLVPGAHVIVASTPLLMHLLDEGLAAAKLERRGAFVRLVRTLRGGDCPKGAAAEFPGVCTMAAGSWEPWLVYRAPFRGTVADCLRRWGTGALRRLPDGRPFSDVIPSGPTPKRERLLADHPSLKPQAFARAVVRAALPLGEGVVADTFMGGGAIVAAAVAVGYRVEGVERRHDYFEVATAAVPRLAALAAP